MDGAEPRVAQGRSSEPTTTILEHRRLHGLGLLLALYVTPAADQDRDKVAALAVAGWAATGNAVAVTSVDQGYPQHGRRPPFVRRALLLIRLFAAWAADSCAEFRPVV